jgi:hypothetical protein
LTTSRRVVQLLPYLPLAFSSSTRESFLNPEGTRQ